MVCASGKATRCPTNTSGFAGIEYQAREAVATVKYTTAVRLKVEQNHLVSVGSRFSCRHVRLQGA